MTGAPSAPGAGVDADPDAAALAAAAADRPAKRSLTLSGHRTSVTLETAFWRRLTALAAADGLSVNALAARVDAARAPDMPLAAALRVYVVERLAAQPSVASAGKVSSSQ